MLSPARGLQSDRLQFAGQVFLKLLKLAINFAEFFRRAIEIAQGSAVFDPSQSPDEVVGSHQAHRPFQRVSRPLESDQVTSSMGGTDFGKDSRCLGRHQVQHIIQDVFEAPDAGEGMLLVKHHGLSRHDPGSLSLNSVSPKLDVRQCELTVRGAG